ncbi:hypothetical protein MTQ24_00860 [Corynebacterium bovis]|uniref:hypothetical protein n=1 Tax=Corynebacterium bovis TaxID=36808 RepID=UPI00313A1CE6
MTGVGAGAGVGAGCGGPVPPVTVLVDGRSGAGKTTLSGRIRGAVVVHLDDLYPGWAGLAAAGDIVAAHVLDPVAPGYRRWDWSAGRPGEWVALDPGADLVVEGCGAVTGATLTAARRRSGDRVLTVDVTGPEGLRRRRALDRDPGFAAFWDLWALQELQHRRTMPEPDLRLTCR